MRVTLTGCANDLHGPYLGLDGRIYWTKGAFSEQTHRLANGSTLKDRAAHIYRARPDGSGLDVLMHGGMDNPVEIAFTPEIKGFAELIPGYMHVRVQANLLVSRRAQPGRDIVERRTPFYVYLKPHGADDAAIRAALRARAQASRLGNRKAYGDARGAAFRAAWRDWCGKS